MKQSNLFILLLFLPGVISIAHAQQQSAEKLQLRQAKKVQMEAGQVFKYLVPLQRGQFASVKVKQESIGIAYALYAPGDSLILHEDYNALNQSEVINIAASKTGDYRVEIFWDYGRPQNGEFVINWDILEPLGKNTAQRAAQLMNTWYHPDEPGAAIAVLRKGKVIFQGMRGLANLEYKIPVTSGSVFDLGSCSKQFTGFAIAMLIDKGLIAFEDDIRKYLPELPVYEKKVTIENLVYHTSGLQNWEHPGNAMGLNPEDAFNMDILYNLMCRLRGLTFTPGERFSYCNSNYNFLALIIERVTGRKFSDWIKENIFTPLGMPNAVVKDEFKKIIPGKVSSYKNGKYGYTVNPDNITTYGSTSLYASINDLSVWINNFDSVRVGSTRLIKLLQRKSRLNNGDTLDFQAFGNFYSIYKGVFRIEHLGLVSGFRTAIARYPSQNLAIIFLAGNTNDATYSRYLNITDVFLQGKIEKPLSASPFPDLKESLAKTMPDVVEKSPVPADEYEGVYYSEELNSHYKIINKDGVLTAISYRFDATPLKWKKEDRFSGSIQQFPRNFEFTRDDKKHIIAFRLTGGEKDILFRKLN